MKKTVLLAVLLCAGEISARRAFGQDLVVDDGTTNITSGTNSFTNAYVGQTTSGNELVVSGGDTVLSNSGFLYVGDSGSGNSLNIDDGGTVAVSGLGIIGRLSDSSNNSVLVTGAGSTWTTGGTLTVGNLGTDNSLVISDGGTVAGGGTGTIGRFGASSNNSVLVTGAGSTWTNGLNLLVGWGGSGNSLVISNGGGVATASIGNIGIEPASSNNSVLVTGAGSTLTVNGSFLRVGNSGSDNSLVISNGGTVAVSGDSVIGFAGISSNNSVLVTGAGSTWTTGGTLTVGNFGPGNSLTLTEGGVVAATGVVIASLDGSSGTLNIGRFGTNDAAGTIDAAAVTFGSGSGILNFNQSNTVTISSVISGNGTVNQLGTGRTILSGTNTYSGATTVSAGSLVVDGSIAAGATIAAGAELGGSGSVGGTLSGAGLIGPGSSPGITTATAVDPSGGLGFAFELTGTGSPAYGTPTASINDVLRLTGATPLTASLVTANAIDVYFLGDIIKDDLFRGGFYLDVGGDFMTSVADATYRFWVSGNGAGTDTTYNGQGYYSLANYDPQLWITIATFAETADFGGGPINGSVMQFAVVPEPSAALLATGLLGGVALLRRSWRKNASKIKR